ncbi:PBAN-type neuropeptides-like isoform X2 [Chelonus insularis]|uniref:PBAN-type neuropeptides-like isoform X2 n=1 Tax=Chelonus insularis TaxID=460826 RepID=UPI00158A54BD|nr:PBAN-type neuropeptides-like isoform X2 [Chelonus insularis]
MFQLKELNLCAGVLASLFLAVLIGLASGDYAHGLDNELCIGSNCQDRSGNGITGSMWFGPRLGRRRRSGPAFETDEEEINAIANAINSGPWALIAYQGDKRHSTQFTPRLGRELGDNLQQKNYKLDRDNLPHLVDSFLDAEQHRHSSQPPFPSPFAPRLGRYLTLNPSSPLGHRFRLVKNY